MPSVESENFTQFQTPSSVQLIKSEINVDPRNDTNFNNKKLHIILRAIILNISILERMELQQTISAKLFHSLPLNFYTKQIKKRKH
jgi:hypothetical protein